MLCLAGGWRVAVAIPVLKSGPILRHTQMIEMPSTSISQDMPIILAVRGFGMKKNKRKSRKELARERYETLEKLEKERYELLRGDPTKPPPFIDVLAEKGPDSWDSTGLLNKYNTRQYRITNNKILNKNYHNLEYIRHLEAEINKDEQFQLRFERMLTALQYQSRLEIAEARKNIMCKEFNGFIGKGKGMSMYPTLIPYVDTVVKMPLLRRSVDKVKKGQVVSFISIKKPRLGTSPKDTRFVSKVVKRIAGLEGDIVDFRGRKYTIPKGYFWALGDNPSVSTDSRHTGAVPLQNIRSRVLFAYKTWYNPFTYKTVTNKSRRG